MKKLLFVTQKVDKDDSILGTYHRWLEKLASRADKIHVICLYKGRVELPSNVEVHSLGKKEGRSRIKYIRRFYRYIWSLRKEYQAVFVHMNPIYVALGGLFWKTSSKKIFLWYNHPLGNLTARAGIFLADKVFCTSPHSFSAKYSKTCLMPVGVDTDFFRKYPSVLRKSNRILYLGRISPIKHIQCLIEAAKVLDQWGVDFELLIVGSPSSDLDKEYEQKLKILAKDLIDYGRIIFKPSVPNHKTAEIYNASAIFVNLTPTGSFDKTILEAMSCGLATVVSNSDFKKMLTSDLEATLTFKEENPEDLAKKLSGILSRPADYKEKLGVELRGLVVGRHDLNSLTEKILYEVK